MLQASAQVLAQHGYQSATTNRIAERAGVSVGTIYQYFSNKDEILDALLQQEIAGYLDAVASAVDDCSEDLATAVGELLRTGFYYRVMLLGMREVRRHAPETVYLRHANGLRNALHALIVDFLADHAVGETPAVRSDHADVLIGICESQVFLPRQQRDEEALIAFLHQAVCHYLRAS